jgi:hypothetical protein
MSELGREELYKLVWSKPGTAAAQELGVSDVALTKRCKREAIPRPPRGYWAKIAAGQIVPIPPLPPPPVREAQPKAAKKVAAPIERPEKLQAPKRVTRRDRSRLARDDRLESFWCKIEHWNRSYSFGVNWRPWKYNDESWSEHDRLDIEASIRSKTTRPYQHIVVWLLPVYVPREKYNRDLRAIGNVWTDRQRKRTLFCSAFIPADAFYSLCNQTARSELLELHVEVINLMRGHGSTSSISFKAELTDLSDD